MPWANQVIPHEDYDYIALADFYDISDFPESEGNNACPIGDVGRVVVVGGTSPPADSDTLDQGSVDIIASSTKVTAQSGVL